MIRHQAGAAEHPKVAHVATVTPSLESLLLDQMLAIQDAGYQVVGIGSPHPRSKALEAAGIRHIGVPMTRNFTPFHDLVSLGRLVRVMRRERFTIVHTHTPKAGLLGQLAARLARVPIVVNTVHGFYLHDHMSPRGRRFYVTIETIAALCSDLILSQNRDDIDTAIGEKICKPNKIKYLGNGINLTVFDPAHVSADDRARCRNELKIPPDARIIGFVGRLAARRKGYLNFLQAAAEVLAHCPNAYFLIIGTADPGKVDAVPPDTLQDLGILNRCLFLGHRPVNDLPGLYALMDVLVLPSLFEGIPRVIMEASAMGVPAIASDVKGNREAVVHGKNGLLVPLGDVHALAEAILDIVRNPELAHSMGEEGRRFALSRFDERIVFRYVIAEYARLLGEKGLALPTLHESPEAAQ
ncbi:MAG: glycosyltransferase family 4 protein [Chloroflexota bacterium]